MLTWAAIGRGRAEWSRTVAAVQWIVQAFVGKWLPPEAIAPPWAIKRAAEPAPAVKSAEVLAVESAIAWSLLYEAWAKRKPPRGA